MGGGGGRPSALPGWTLEEEEASGNNGYESFLSSRVMKMMMICGDDDHDDDISGGQISPGGCGVIWKCFDCTFVIFLEITMITDMLHTGKIVSATCLDTHKSLHNLGSDNCLFCNLGKLYNF